MFKKQHLPLIIGFSIPLLMILFVAFSIYVPGFFNRPKYNFLYSSNNDYYDKVYSVNNGKLIEIPQPTPYPGNIPSPTPQLYVYNVTTNESTPISFDETQNLKLDSSTKSPDGYKIEKGNNSGGFLFWYSRDYETQYIVGHNMSRKLDLKTTGPSYYDSDYFLGWIIE